MNEGVVYAGARHTPRRALSPTAGSGGGGVWARAPLPPAPSQPP